MEWHIYLLHHREITSFLVNIHFSEKQIRRNELSFYLKKTKPDKACTYYLYYYYLETFSQHRKASCVGAFAFIWRFATICLRARLLTRLQKAARNKLQIIHTCSFTPFLPSPAILFIHIRVIIMSDVRLLSSHEQESFEGEKTWK